MLAKQIILLLCILWFGESLAKSFRPTSFDYDYREDIPKASKNYRGKSATTTPRQSIQQYWQNFVRNIPTLPPFRWNMTNSLTNLFNAGAQQIMETPIGIHEIMEDEPHRRRKSPKRKSTTKRNKNHRVVQSKVHNNYYNYPTPAHEGGYQQIQLQPLGVDEKHVMHFYEPKTRQYYAMYMSSDPPSPYSQNSYNYYNNQAQQSYEKPNEEDDAHYQDESHDNEGYGDDQVYGDDKGYAKEEQEHDNEYDTENMDYDNEYNNAAEPESEGNEASADDAVLADNWGYPDDEVFGKIKLKGNLKPIQTQMLEKEIINKDISGNTVKIQKQFLNPETEEDVIILISKDQKPIAKKTKTTVHEETTTDHKDIESVRNAIGTFMKDDRINRLRQRANTKQSTRLVEMPRQSERYYILPANFWLK